MQLNKKKWTYLLCQKPLPNHTHRIVGYHTMLAVSYTTSVQHAMQWGQIQQMCFMFWLWDDLFTGRQCVRFGVLRQNVIIVDFRALLYMFEWVTLWFQLTSALNQGPVHKVPLNICMLFFRVKWIHSGRKRKKRKPDSYFISDMAK